MNRISSISRLSHGHGHADGSRQNAAERVKRAVGKRRLRHRRWGAEEFAPVDPEFDEGADEGLVSQIAREAGENVDPEGE